VIEVIIVRKAIYWTVRVIAILLTIKLALWAYQNYWPGDQGHQQQEVFDIDKLCKMDADTGLCMCRHRRTNERLTIPHEECVSLAGRP